MNHHIPDNIVVVENVERRDISLREETALRRWRKRTTPILTVNQSIRSKNSPPQSPKTELEAFDLFF